MLSYVEICCALLCYVVPCSLMLGAFVLLCHAIRCSMLSFIAICCAMLHSVVLYILCYAVPCSSILCDAVLCCALFPYMYVMLFCAMLCYVVNFFC